MLAVIRVILMTLALVFISLCSILFCLIRPFHRDNVHHTAKYLGKVSKILGLEVEIRIPESTKNIGPVVYICNHQNSYDIFTVPAAVQLGTVSVGKKSLKWIPFFGQMYWLTGNILIDRKNKNKAMNTIDMTANKIREKKLSVWLFPEGTRSYGRGLLPFKTGAFRTAAKAEVPIVPVCASNTHKTIDLNRWDNGKMIVEFLPPVYLSNEDKDKIRTITNKTHSDMLVKIKELSLETGHELPVVNDKKSQNKQTSESK
ncbi:1-acylglycerol-3-phosphate O-acyltransferase [Colwellia sp. BRX10-3]|uniref:1-acylglycerol-3-phosphate O-acyltransferase n=1 Tax=Colwellia sp. BRX10-3 TaxID=2759844 RepID=UPI0015F6F152|nr:1-acylglycerol-3-phosphate O-acyltransferase [Colwellia sp. BRX10-3]MBA6389649.1 1-acylglycerol-3-phosphate O-acyltransferase [Colwellia sp. BRX10-3]